MTVHILTSRALPLPQTMPDGQPIKWTPLAEARAAPPAAILLSTSLDTLDAEMIGQLPDSIKLIANLGVGVDHIDIPAAHARGLVVSNTPTVTDDTADLTFGLILAAARRIGQNERYLRAGKWQEPGAMGIMGARVHGQTLGLIGFGNIGQAVAKRATGFGMVIRYWNRSAKPEAERAYCAERVPDLRALVESADIVSLHTALTPETRHIVNAELLGHFKKGAVLVNTSRGPLVDEAALAAALKAEHLSAAGLDVFEREPDVHEVLLARDNVVLTPHVGSATSMSHREIITCGLANIEAFLQTGQPLNPVEK